ncbi:MAG: methyltransferase domain-containing protein [Cyclobacteriaceae bacterium]
MKEFWNDRYNIEDSAYGYEPNEYFKKQLSKLEPDKILLPAEGEGRNAIYASKLGWEVSAFDISEQGKIKAEILAQKNGVSIDYQIGEFEDIEYEQEYFGAIGLIYAHFTAELKSKYHKILDGYLKKGGIVIFEAFSKNNLELVKQNRNTNGPKDIDALFSVDEIREDFNNYDIMELGEEILELNEGLYHKGQSSIIRFVGRKK